MKTPSVPWSLLSAFGNTPLAKAVVFSPLVAGYVYYSSEYLQSRWGFENAIWLYWSLILLSLGQALYLIFAPQEVRRYGDNFEDYASKALGTWSEVIFEYHALRYVSSFFVPHRNGTLKLSEGAEFNEDEFRQSLEPFVPQSGGADPHASLRWLVESIAYKRRLRPNLAARRINPDGLELILSKLQKKELSEAQRFDVRRVTNFMNRQHDSPEWKKDILSYSFEAAQRSKLIVRYSIFLLYLLGSAYFVYNTSRTIAQMVAVTIRIE
ncbi:hypothetical protein K1X12_01085 [Hyphomonas sp. WL0036]|uniref:hypothetical protein n=1 Tax=Hyphomonas sediminis TaxID=2866160 RepID=UPI001C808281|nr:hypothetical protein [Hyphomonas sediminis]MBY9065471.1 hypothetical protein [Hyphomonas sediminis]